MLIFRNNLVFSRVKYGFLCCQCDWICDVNEEDETYKCLKDGDFWDDVQTCDDGTDEDYCEAVSFF